MQGKCVVDKFVEDGGKINKQLLINQMQQDHEFMRSNEEPMTKLALISSLGTANRPVLCSRPNKPLHQSTLRPEYREYLRQRLVTKETEKKMMKKQMKIMENLEKMEEKEGNKRDEKMGGRRDEDEFCGVREIGGGDDGDVKKEVTIRSVEEIINSLHMENQSGQDESDAKLDYLIKQVMIEDEEAGEEAEDGKEDKEVLEVDRDERMSSCVDNDADNDNKSDHGRGSYVGEFEKEAEKVILEIESERNQMMSSVAGIDVMEDVGDKMEEDKGPENEGDVLKCFSVKIHEGKLRQSRDLVGEGVRGVAERRKKHEHQSIHDLCTLNSCNDIKMSNTWRVNFVRDRWSKYGMNEEVKQERMLNIDEVEKDDDGEDGDRMRLDRITDGIMNEIDKLKKEAEEMLNSEENLLKPVIVPIQPKHRQISDIWDSYPPKLFMSSTECCQYLCPDIIMPLKEDRSHDVRTPVDGSRGATECGRFTGVGSKCISDNMLDEDLEEFEDKIDVEALQTWNKLINNRSRSDEDVSVCTTEDMRRRGRRRRASVPNKHWLEEDSLIVNLEYHLIMKEIELQKRRILALRLEVENKENVDNIELEEEGIEQEGDDRDEGKALFEEDSELGVECDISINVMEPEREGTENKIDNAVVVHSPLTDAQKALMAARNYVYYPPRKSQKSSGKNNNQKELRLSKKHMERITCIEKFLRRTPNKLKREESLTILYDKLYYNKYTDTIEQEPQFYSRYRSKSLTKLESFANWSDKHGYNNHVNCRDWITVIWDQWFDEVYPPLPSELTWMPSNDTQQITVPNTVGIETQQPTMATTNESIDKSISVVLGEIELPDKIDPFLDEVDETFKQKLLETLHLEVIDLTNEMEKSPERNPFLLSRRGALYRKLGYLKAGLADLNEAIQICPQLITAYWDRHLLYLVANKQTAALDDLNYILRVNKTYLPAYKSRAAIYTTLGDTSLAISNWSQAIRLCPDDSDGYLKRAQLYESNGDDRLALEDYNNLIRLQPNNSRAMMKHGLYYLRIEQWQLAVKDFSAVLRHDHNHIDARLHRADALTKLFQWQEALSDYSSLIHLHPNNPISYYKRGCLLRIAEPKMAIRDLSISLLLDSSEDNVMAYFHRGVLYAQTRQYPEAIIDLEMVICLNKDLCCGHIDLGIIYFEMKNYEKAVKYFTSGLIADPTYTRAYACRAESYFYLQQYDEAIKDINRAIHIHPDRSNYYMLRGDFYLAQGRMELAAMCVRQAAEISHSLGQSPVQQALVHSFLSNYDQAIEALQQATRVKPTIALLNLLGTTQMKATRWNDAIASFSTCLEQMRPKNQFKPWPAGAANLYFQIAQCYLELSNYKKSQEAFRNTVKINPKHAEAFYQQGWCRLRLDKPKHGILDLNRALALNPSLFRVYLARATLFGRRGQFSKAILNCNEALRIEPSSIRGYLYRAVLKYKIKSYSLSIKDFSAAIQLDRNCILAYYNRALCYSAQNKFQCDAIRDYSIVLLLSDTLQLHLKSFINRGNVYLNLDDVSNALNDFRCAAEHQPDNLDILLNIGYCYHKLGRLAEAIQIFSRCLDHDSKYHVAKISRANAYMDYNTDKSRLYAIHDYLSVIRIQPNNPNALINLGYCKMAQGKFKEAWDLFTKLISTEMDCNWLAKGLDGRAIVCMQMRDLMGALKDLNRGIEVNPSGCYLYINRGVVHQLMRDSQRAILDYNKAILISPAASSVALYNLSCIYLHNFQMGQAQKCLERSMVYDDQDEGGWANLGIVKSVLGNKESALQCYQTALKIAPYAAYLYYNKAMLLASLDQYPQALEFINKSLQLAPDDPQTYKIRADCKRNVGDAAGALQDYRTSIKISAALRNDR